MAEQNALSHVLLGNTTEEMVKKINTAIDQVNINTDEHENTVKDVKVNNTSVVDEKGIANITVPTDYIPIGQKGLAGGVATLGTDGKVPSTQLPSYVDDVLEYDNSDSFPATGETGKIYVAKDTNKTYRWSGSQYTEISASLVIGEKSSTAYAGDKGKANADNIKAIQDNYVKKGMGHTELPAGKIIMGAGDSSVGASNCELIDYIDDSINIPSAGAVKAYADKVKVTTIPKSITLLPTTAGTSIEDTWYYSFYIHYDEHGNMYSDYYFVYTNKSFRVSQVFLEVGSEVVCWKGRMVEHHDGAESTATGYPFFIVHSDCFESMKGATVILAKP